MPKESNINNLSPAAIQCRAWRHAWKGSTADLISLNRKKGYWVTLICDRGCGTRKQFFLSMAGEYGAPHILYGEGYLLDHRITKDEMGEVKRLALVDLLGESDQDKQVNAPTPISAAKGKGTRK